MIARGWGSPAPAPSGATRSGSAERQPSEIPSQTQSVSAFLLSGPSTGPRSSGDVRSEPKPRAVKSLDVGLQDRTRFLGRLSRANDDSCQPIWCAGVRSEKDSRPLIRRHVTILFNDSGLTVAAQPVQPIHHLSH